MSGIHPSRGGTYQPRDATLALLALEGASVIIIMRSARPIHATIVESSSGASWVRPWGCARAVRVAWAEVRSAHASTPLPWDRLTELAREQRERFELHAEFTP